MLAIVEKCDAVEINHATTARKLTFSVPIFWLLKKKVLRDLEARSFLAFGRHRKSQIRPAVLLLLYRL